MAITLEQLWEETRFSPNPSQFEAITHVEAHCSPRRSRFRQNTGSFVAHGNLIVHDAVTAEKVRLAPDVH